MLTLGEVDIIRLQGHNYSNEYSKVLNSVTWRSVIVSLSTNCQSPSVDQSSVTRFAGYCGSFSQYIFFLILETKICMLRDLASYMYVHCKPGSS